MRYPTRADLPDLQTSDPEVFKRFLLSGFRGLFEENKDRHAFGSAAPFIDRTGSLVADLEDIHDCLDAAEQLGFQEGCVRAVEEVVHCDPSSRYQIAVSLIALAGRVRASRLLDSLSNVVRKVANDIDDQDQKAELYRAAFEGAVAASTPTAKARDCLIDLCGQRAMPSRLAPVVLLRLVEADPDRVVDHFTMLWAQLDAAIGWAPHTANPKSDDPEEQSRAAQRIYLMQKVFARLTVDQFYATLAPLPRMESRRFGLPDMWLPHRDWWARTLPALPRVLQYCSDAISHAGSRATPIETLQIGEGELSATKQTMIESQVLMGGRGIAMAYSEMQLLNAGDSFSESQP